VNKLLVICGPTAIGKTSVGIKLAKKFNGEIISADSRQVYKGMDIGTGKEIINSAVFNLQFSNDKFDIGNYEISGVPVWLLDMAEPDKQVTVADWKAGAEIVISQLTKENKLPIVVGGTGFYIQALVDGIDTLGIPPDEQLRQQLSDWPVERIQNKLKNLDAEIYQKLNRSDRHNSHRLIRKIEIAMARENSQYHSSNHDTGGWQGRVLKVGLKAPNQYIYQRIDQRAEQRLEDGLLGEIKNLLAKGYGWDDPGMNTLAYKEFRDYFENNQSLEECIQRWKYDEHGYARRQLTWFKGEEKINWFDITQDKWIDDLEKIVHNWYS
jgi:tRNA dimethylallyltransferase